MDDSALRKHTRLNLLIVLTVAVLAALYGWFTQPDGGALWLGLAMLGVVGLPLIALILLIIFAMLIRDGWRIANQTEGAGTLARSTALVSLAATIAVGLTLPPLFSNWHRDHLLSTNEAAFARAMASDARRVTLTNGQEIVSTAEAGWRHYFSLGGLADNHQGFVYDPSGRVALAQGWADGEAGRFTAPDDVRTLFGGDLLECVPVRGDWFYCSFT